MCAQFYFITLSPFFEIRFHLAMTEEGSENKSCSFFFVLFQKEEGKNSRHKIN